jgi:hypothetical protein
MTEQERNGLKAGDRVLLEYKSYKYVPATIMQVASPLGEKDPMFLMRYGMLGRQRWYKPYYLVAKLD